MAQQNIYDNEIFYEGYKKIRENAINANNLFEIPALLSMLPELKGKRVLDLGCGFGEHCKLFVNYGAEKVVGVDISNKMLEVAKKENSDPKIVYVNMPMEEALSSKLCKFFQKVNNFSFPHRGIANLCGKLLSN